MPESEDNYGVLFEEAKKGRSFSDLVRKLELIFAGMRERVSSLYGRIRIKGDKESGNGIKVSIPLISRIKND